MGPKSYVSLILNSGDAGIGAGVMIFFGWLIAQVGFGSFGMGMAMGAGLTAAMAVGVNFGFRYLANAGAAVRTVVNLLRS